MSDLIKESITLVPQPVFRKAKELYNRELYEAALELLRDNSVKFDIYEGLNRMEVSIAAPRKNTAFDSNRGKPFRKVNKK